MDPHQLIQRYLTGQATGPEMAELDRLLANDPALRRKFIVETGIDAGLREVAFERAAQPGSTDRKIISPIFRPIAWIAVAAALMLMGTMGWTRFSRPPVIATLLSGENASWESSLPTTPGSALTPGYLKLNTGIATILFRSGAKVVLEAPAHLVLETPMRGRLIDGSAVIDVPKSAIGFIMAAPGGYAVDHGTQFAVSANESKNSSNFEVLKGEISVHNPATGEEVRLKGRQGASIREKALSTFDGATLEPALPQVSPVLRVGTNGHATYIIRNNKRGKWIHPEMLYVRQALEAKWDMQAVFSFDISKAPLASAISARLRLNQVQSGVGLAARLPLINTFAIYGVQRPRSTVWIDAPLWEDAPGPEDGILLGKFDIPRSQQSGSVGIDTPLLLDFLKTAPRGIATFILVRETGVIDGEGKGLVHAFASDSNPEASGPLLEFTLHESL